jgi:hypothetical protein
MGLITNKDGSVDVYVGPDAPEGKESNWIATVKGQAWFPYFRLYSPKQAFLDHSWVLPDIEMVIAMPGYFVDYNVPMNDYGMEIRNEVSPSLGVN